MKYLRNALTQIIILLLGFLIVSLVMRFVNLGTETDYLIKNDPDGTTTIREALYSQYGSSFFELSDDVKNNTVYQWCEGHFGSALENVLNITVKHRTGRNIALYLWLYGPIAGLFCWFLGLGLLVVMVRKLLGKSAGIYGTVSKVMNYGVQNGWAWEVEYSDGSTGISDPFGTAGCLIGVVITAARCALALQAMSITGYLMPLSFLLNLCLMVLSIPGHLLSKLMNNSIQKDMVAERTKQGFKSYTVVNYYGSAMVVNCADPKDAYFFKTDANAYVAKTIMNADGEGREILVPEINKLYERINYNAISDQFFICSLKSIPALLLTSKGRNVLSILDNPVFVKKIPNKENGIYNYSFTKKNSPFQLRVNNISNMAMICDILMSDEKNSTYDYGSASKYLEMSSDDKLEFFNTFCQTHKAE